MASSKIMMCLLSLAFSCTCIANNQSHPCSSVLWISDKKAYFSHSGHLSPDAGVALTVTGENCVININSQIYEVIKDLVNRKLSEKKEVKVNLDFICVNAPVDIHFETAGLNVFNNSAIMLEVVIETCTVSIDNLSKLSQFGRIYLIIASMNVIMQSNESSCGFADGLIELMCTIGRSKNKSQNLNYTQFFWEKCNDIFPNAALLTIKVFDKSLYHLPSRMLVNKFPNLQSLAMTNVKIVEPLVFPWTSVFAKISDIDKVLFFKQSAVNGSVNQLAWDTQQRIFEITGEYTWDVENITLTGYISQIRIKNTSIHVLKGSTFHNVKRLLRIDLSNNFIRIIENDLFQNQVLLETLNLELNEISSLANGVFNSLNNLRYLNMASNNIKALPRGVFRSLRKLSEIHMEHNFLKTLPVDIFKYQIMAFRNVFLHSNPLEEIPTELFYSPKINVIDMHNTSVSGISIVRLLNRLDVEVLVSTSSFQINPATGSILDRYTNMRHLDLSQANITHIPIALKIKQAIHQGVLLLRILNTFIINFDGSPFDCSGLFTYQLQLILQVNPTKYSNRTIQSWLCVTPAELKGRHILSLSTHDIYILVDLRLCPSKCACKERLDNSSVIVDCSNKAIHDMPENLPLFILELWFQNSNISQIRPRSYYPNVTILNLSGSKVYYIDPSSLTLFKVLKAMFLDSNHLAMVPVQIRSLKVGNMTLRHNPFMCDCHSGWMKQWLLERDCPVMDWDEISCSVKSKQGKQLITVPSNQFTCHVTSKLEVIQHVVMPTIIVGSFLFVVLVVSLIVYFQRLTIKVLLYIYFGIHPFDNDDNLRAQCEFDALVFYTFGDMEFVKENIINYLSEKLYKIADLHFDFIVGVSFIENIESFIQKSKRIIFIFPENPFENELMKLAWDKAYEKTVDSCANSIILVVTDRSRAKNLDKNLSRYIRNGRYINKDSGLLVKYVEYLMAKPSMLKASQFQPTFDNGEDTFISYPDESHEHIRYELIPYLHENNHKVKFFEFEITPGGVMQEEIVDVLERARRLIFVISAETINDENQMAILKTAISKTMSNNYNYLLVFTYGTIPVDEMSSDVKNYVDNYVTVSLKNEYYKERLLRALNEDYNRKCNDEDADEDTDEFQTLV